MFRLPGLVSRTGSETAFPTWLVVTLGHEQYRFDCFSVQRVLDRGVDVFESILGDQSVEGELALKVEIYQFWYENLRNRIALDHLGCPATVR